MSIRALSWVWEESKQEAGALLVLLALADFAHPDGDGAYPSIERLAHKSRKSIRQTQVILRELEQAGEIEVSYGTGPHAVNQYRICGLPPEENPQAPTPYQRTRQVVFDRDGGKCVYCGQQAEVLDHYLPVALGGRSTLQNLVAACRACNQAKGAKHPRDFAPRSFRTPQFPVGGGAENRTGGVRKTAPKPLSEPLSEPLLRDGTSADADRATPAGTADETLMVTDSEEQVTAPPHSAEAPPWLVEARQLPKWTGGAERETALAGWLRERGVSDDCALRAAVALRAKWGTMKRHTYTDTEAALRNWCLTQVQIDAKGNGSAKGENARWLEGMRGVERGASRGRPVETI